MSDSGQINFEGHEEDIFRVLQNEERDESQALIASVVEESGCTVVWGESNYPQREEHLRTCEFCSQAFNRLIQKSLLKYDEK